MSLHQFGGDWTKQKLEKVAAYLQAYTTIMSQQRNLRAAYIDAFAGTRYRSTSSTLRPLADDDLFPNLAENEPQELLSGSTRIALETKPEFEVLIFIEKDTERTGDLQSLKQEYPNRDIRVINDDANHYLYELAEKKWKSRRAVLFLDPYGMQVDWTTLTSVASTQAIDVWILFPLGVAVNRLLTRSGEISEAWRSRLTRTFGTEDWYRAFYEEQTESDFFGERQSIRKAATLESIGQFYIERLKTIFPHVAPEPSILRNSRANPLYLLCFAAANPRKGDLAVRIAHHILRM